MARPKSEDKRNAIIDAATHLFAERGLIPLPQRQRYQKQAGVAEGTLFTYFKTKDDLINALYREIKLELADAMMSDFPPEEECSHQAAACLGSLCPIGALRILSSARALAQLQVSEVVTKESKDAGGAPVRRVPNHDS